MDYVRLAVLAVSIGIGFAASAQTATKTSPQADIAAGRELFKQRCSACHGLDAKGAKGTGLQGPMAIYDPQSIDPARRVPPADLTALSEQNAGKFPAERVKNAISFNGSIPAHGTPDMPAWGDVFYSLKADPQLLERCVRDLTAYSESIQATKM
jgi:mono/diheme cytochrome c family protein